MFLRREAAGGDVGCFGGEPVGEEPDLFAEALGACVVWEQLGEFVLEDAGAAWLEKDEGQAGVDLLEPCVEDVGEVAARGVESRPKS